ncbi:hypothetical protein GGR23_001289 [Gellertiella hungarica]|uniref:Flagellar protein n=2 Tax=Gellertiella hungarica TaxID=1572859 RepID=A0A7W6J4V7_9HYPH|nr:hypothetical protein [Gellertiella hungarica]
MTELDLETDDDMPVPPLAGPRRKSVWVDRVLIATGITMAAAAAFFPWYVFFNEDKFGIRVAAIDRSRDLPHTGPRNVFSVSPMAMVNRNKNPNPQPLPMDQLTTASVSSLGKDKNTRPVPMEEQPFPGPTGFRLLHVANGRAMIEDRSGMYMVRVGSILPDQSRLAALEQRNGQWVIVTSKGNVFAPE